MQRPYLTVAPLLSAPDFVKGWEGYIFYLPLNLPSFGYFCFGFLIKYSVWKHVCVSVHVKCYLKSFSNKAMCSFLPIWCPKMLTAFSLFDLFVYLIPQHCITAPELYSNPNIIIINTTTTYFPQASVLKSITFKNSGSRCKQIGCVVILMDHESGIKIGIILFRQYRWICNGQYINISNKNILKVLLFILKA